MIKTASNSSWTTTIESTVNSLNSLDIKEKNINDLKLTLTKLRTL
jgi:hypothetical protein